MKWGIRCELNLLQHPAPLPSYDLKDGNPQCWFGGNNNPYLFNDINTAFRECFELNKNPANKHQVKYYYVKDFN